MFFIFPNLCKIRFIGRNRSKSQSISSFFSFHTKSSHKSKSYLSTLSNQRAATGKREAAAAATESTAASIERTAKPSAKLSSNRRKYQFLRTFNDNSTNIPRIGRNHGYSRSKCDRHGKFADWKLWYSAMFLLITFWLCFCCVSFFLPDSPARHRVPATQHQPPLPRRTGTIQPMQSASHGQPLRSGYHRRRSARTASGAARGGGGKMR